MFYLHRLDIYHHQLLSSTEVIVQRLDFDRRESKKKLLSIGEKYSDNEQAYCMEILEGIDWVWYV